MQSTFTQQINDKCLVRTSHKALKIARNCVIYIRCIMLCDSDNFKYPGEIN